MFPKATFIDLFENLVLDDVRRGHTPCGTKHISPARGVTNLWTWRRARGQVVE